MAVLAPIPVSLLRTPGRLARACVALGLLATAARAIEPLRFRFPPGAELRFRLVMEGRTLVFAGERQAEIPLRTTLNLTQRVIAVAPDGVARVLTRIESGKLVQGEGDEGRIIPPREATMRVDPRGRILDGEGAGVNLAQLQLVLPEEPLEVGGSWTSSLPPSQEVPVPIQVRYTVLGSRYEAGQDCVEIGVKMSTARASAVDDSLGLEFEADGTILFAPALGAMVSSRIDSKLEIGFDHAGEEGPVETRARIELGLRLTYRPGL